MFFEDFKSKIESLLPRGAENAVSAATLAAQCHMTPRQLRHAVRSARAAGVPVLSSYRRHGGYYLPDTGQKRRQEIDDFCRRCRRRAVRELDQLAPFLRDLKEAAGQLNLSSDFSE